MLFLFVCGVVCGIILVLAVQYVIFFNPFGQDEGDPDSADQFPRFVIPKELKQLLVGKENEEALKKKEHCLSWNLFFQFLFQELKTSGRFRRWLLRKLQIELNDLTSRTGIGRLVQDIRVRDFAVGNQFPIIKGIRVEKAELSSDSAYFEELDLILDIEYRGGFHLAMDVQAVLGRRAFLSVKVVKLAGTARLRLTRQPYSHWSFSFLRDPTMDLKVDSKFEGRPLAQLVPLIIQQFRRAVRRKHVLPQSKIRYRPFFTNSFLQPTANPSDFTHIQVRGTLELTIHSCSRLHLTRPAALGHSLVFCRVEIGLKPVFYDELKPEQSVTLLLILNRHSTSEPTGVTFTRLLQTQEKTSSAGALPVIQVENVRPGSAAERMGFQKGDVVLTINNLLITSEKQATKVLSGTIGELLVLVKRRLENIEDDEEITDRVTVSPKRRIRVQDFDGDFLNVEFDTGDLSPSGSMLSLSPKSRSMNDLTKAGTDTKAESGTRVLEQPRNLLSPPPLRKVRSASLLHSKHLKTTQSEAEMVPVKKLSLEPNSADRIVVPPRPKSSMEGDLNVTYQSSSPSTSLSNQSPSLTRRQKLLAKATEKGSQVANKWQVGQKWQIGKATVKGLWNKHRGSTQMEYGEMSDFEELSAPPMEEKKVAEPEPPMSLSKSEESKLSLRVGGRGSDASSRNSTAHNLEVEEEGVEGTDSQRKRSFSEPDTLVHSLQPVEPADMPFTKPVFDGLSTKSDSLQSPEAVPASPDISITSDTLLGPERKAKRKSSFMEKRTTLLPLKKEVEWEQTMFLPLENRPKYLSLSLWSCGERESDKALMGYVNMYVPEVLDDCSITISNVHQQILNWRPSIEASVSAISKFQKQTTLPGFDPRLCHGDVNLTFHWIPDQSCADAESLAKSSSRAPSLHQSVGTFGEQSSIKSEISGSGHDWMPTHFQQAVFCGFCQRKIWLKTASQCLECLLICHKKCQPKAEELMACGGKLLLRGESSSTQVDGYSIETGEDAVLMEASSSQDITQLGKTRRIQMALSGKISNLRWRKPHGQAEAKAPEGERKAIDEESSYSNQLYTKGGTYNESVINAAKDLGKDLFLDLPPGERKQKINEQVDNLQQEIDQITRERMGLMQKSKPFSPETKERLEKLDEKLQSLAVLMLHYCAGLQHCLDLEDGPPMDTFATPIEGLPKLTKTEADDVECGELLDEEDFASESESFVEEVVQSINLPENEDLISVEQEEIVLNRSI